MKAILTIGVPGCGKSTWAKKQVGYTDINLDECRLKVSGDATNQSVNAQAVELRNKMILDAKAQEQNIIISDTNANEKYRLELIAYLEQLGFEVLENIFVVSLDECLERNSKRDRIVPPEVLEKTHNNIQASHFKINQIIDKNGEDLNQSEIISLLRFKFFNITDSSLLEDGLINGAELTAQAQEVLSFVERNYNLLSFNPSVFLYGLSDQVLDINHFLLSSGLNEDALSKFNYQDVSLYEKIDDRWVSSDLYAKLLNNLILLIS